MACDVSPVAIFCLDKPARLRFSIFETHPKLLQMLSSIGWFPKTFCFDEVIMVILVHLVIVDPKLLDAEQNMYLYFTKCLYYDFCKYDKKRHLRWM